MDLKKCRTCFCDLDTNDLYQKLNVIHKNSKLCLAEKLKACIPTMDLTYTDNLYICMQCSMQLETAFAFYTTCLQAEEMFQKYASQMTKSYLEKEKSKTIQLSCPTCNINFSTKNIFDLHMKVMHSTDEIKTENVEVKEEKRHLQKKESFVRRVSLQDTVGEKKKHQSTKNAKVLKNNSNQLKGVKRKVSQTTIDKRRELGKLQCATLKRDASGKFLKRNVKNNHSVVKKSQSEVPCNTNVTTKNIIKENNSEKCKNNITDDCSTLEDNVKLNKITEKERTFKCRFCLRRYYLYGHLSRHWMAAHKEKCQQCKVCKRYYTNNKEHRKAFGCKEVPPSAKPQTKIDIEIKIRNGTEYHISKEKNISYIYKGEKELICIICDRKNRSAVEMKRHVVQKHSSKPIACEACSVKFSCLKYCFHIANDCTQMRYFNYTSDGECICPVCDKILPNRKSLNGHLSCHTRETLVCKQCNQVFNKIQLYGQHVVKGCQEIKAKLENITEYFEREFQSENATRTMQEIENPDPLLEENSSLQNSYNVSDVTTCNLYTKESPPHIDFDLSETSRNKSIKIEPTELLDNNTYISTESEEDANLFLPSVNEQFDKPELIFLLPNTSTTG